MAKSLENDRALAPMSANPFQTEIKLYQKEFQAGDIATVVVVPDFYHIALPNLGHQLVEHQINQEAGFFADRAYLSQEYGLLKEHPNIKPELIFISMSYEGSFVRALRMLDLLGCPLTRAERTEADPLVIFGGWSVTKNPLPLFELADVIGIGESQQMIKDITSVYKRHRGSKQEFFDEAVAKQGLIVPGRYQVKTERGYLTQWEAMNAPLDIYPGKSTAFPHSLYLSPETDYNDIGYYEGRTFFSMEITDACNSKCGYCGSGFKEKTRDIQDPRAIVDLAEWGATFGADLVKLFYPAHTSLTAVKDIMKELMARGLHPRVGSAKAEKIDREYVELVGRAGQEKIALAPETGDYELRKAVGKSGMTNEVLERVIVTSVNAGIPNLDFYLILNVPGEAKTSMDQTIDMLGSFLKLAKSKGLKGRMRVAAPNFFPKAWTPFQFGASGSIEGYESKISQLSGQLDESIKLSHMSGSVDLLSQNIVSRGGIEVGKILLEVYRSLKQKAVAEGRFCEDNFDDWRQALHTLNIDEQDYFRERRTDKPMPWHHIHINERIGLPTLIKYWKIFKGKRMLLAFD